MTESVLGNLVVRLRGDASHLEKAARENSKRMKSWADGISKSVKVAAASLTGLAAGMSLAVRGMIKEAEKMGRASQSLGVPIEKLTALKYAAEQAGVPFETLSTTLTRFNNTLGQIASGQINPAATALQTLGISATTSTGALKSNTDLLTEVADRFARLKDDANKTSIAIALFGQQGAQLTPLLNRGANGIKDLTEEAERLGLVIDSKTARTAAQFNEALQKIGAAGRGTAMALAERLLPDLNLLANALANAAEKSKSFIVVLDGLEIAMKGISTMFVVAAGNLTALIGGLQVLYTFARDFKNLGWDKAIESSTKKIDELKESLQGIGGVISGIWGLDDGSTDRFNFAGRLSEMGVEIPQALAPAMQSVNDLNAEFNALREASRTALAELLDSPTETVAAKLDAITQAAREGVISFREFGQAVSQVAREGERQMDDLLSATSSALTSMFQQNKTAAISSALINTYQGITRALAQYPPPYAQAMAAIQAAQGFAQVAAIRNTSKNSSGGAASSSGGTASSGSVGSGADEGGPGAFSQSLFVQGIKPSDLYTGRVVRDLAAALLQFQRDGGTVLLESS